MNRARWSYKKADWLSKAKSWGVVSLMLLWGGASQASTVISRHSAFDYDPGTGLLTKEVIEPGDSNLCLVTVHGYDSYGNVNANTTRNCNGSAGSFSGSSASVNGEAVAPASNNLAVIPSRSNSTTFTADGRFPLTSTNALGQTETKTFDPVLGVVTKLVGPNALATQWAYDTFGRKLVEQRADGTGTKWAYDYCQTTAYSSGTASCPTVNGVQAVYVTTTTPISGADVTTPTAGTAIGPYSKVYYDALNRAIRTETQGYDGTGTSTLIYQDSWYNDKGQVTQSSRPYFAGAGTIAWTKYTYDTLGRVKVIQFADNSQSTTSYSGLVTTVTNDKSQTTTETRNVVGQVVSVKNAYNKLLTKTWDATGNLLTTTDALGNVVTLTYDLRGRKKTMKDPDMGSWTYWYNALGNVVAQQDAKGQITMSYYDVLGRLVEKDEPTQNSEWYYDKYMDGSACNKGIGKLCEASSDNGYGRKHVYDSYGRPSSTTSTIGSAYTVSTTYDATTGRADTIAYPGSNLRLKNVYTPLGYLKQVINADAPSSVYWKADSLDAEGRLTQQTTGNLITTVNTFDPLTGLLKGTKAGASGSSSYAVQNVSYDYDTLGNLKTLSDSDAGASAVYTYDDLNRLKTETRLGTAVTTAQVITWNYDDIGNVISRSDVGTTFNYPASGASSVRPHAISSVTGTVNGVTNPAYTYDANGNLLTATGRTVAWNSFNKIDSISRTTGSTINKLAYLYDAETERVKETYIQNGTLQRTTVYLNPGAGAGLFYEEEITPAGTKKKHYINAGGSVIGVLTLNTANNTWTTQYWHKDNLGSTVVVTDGVGAVTERMSYEPFGKRRKVDGTTDLMATLAVSSTRRGFTGHEMMDEVGLVNMNGRVYDPAIGRFLSADPYIQQASNLQSYNRYSYGINNPLNGIDPTGYLFGIKSPFHSIDQFLHNPGRALEHGWKSVYNTTIGRVAITIAVAVITDGMVAGSDWALCTVQGAEYGGVAGAAAGGFAGGLAGSNGHLKAGVQGALTAVAFYEVGTATGMHNPNWNDVTPSQFAANVGGHALVGCASAMAQGGNCGRGAASAGVAALATPFYDQGVAGLAESAVVGGTTSAIGGGKFGDGAITGAFGYLFNACAKGPTSCTSQEIARGENEGATPACPECNLIGAGGAVKGLFGLVEYAASSTGSLVTALSNAVEVGSALKADSIHYAAVFVRDEALQVGQYFTVVGGDGAARVLVQMQAVGGRFEYMYQQAKTGWELTHQMFVQGGKVNGVPIKP